MKNPPRVSNGSKNPNQLVVEGPDDLFAVAGLMRAHIDWPEEKNDSPVWIEKLDGINNILAAGNLTARFKVSGLKSLGVIVDADVDLVHRYESIRNLVRSVFPDMPDEMPKSGLIIQAGEKKFGVWIMPDNVSSGTLETFLKNLVPDTNNTLWEHAKQSVVKAKEIGAPCRDTHIEKANLHTLLAWHDPPGQTLGVALTKRALDPTSPYANDFVSWFKELYDLP